MKDPMELIGKCFVWEPLRPHATASVVVQDAWDNGHEWWVATVDLVTGKMHRNELSRFIEAVTLSAEQVDAIVATDRTGVPRESR